jgi:uncharacterized membrane protein YgdD (TMEM256/DUF423 family)
MILAQARLRRGTAFATTPLLSSASRPTRTRVDAQHPPLSPLQRALVAAGGLLAAAAVALSAYASHAVHGEGRASLLTAAVFAFGHGVALAALAPRAQRRTDRLALCVLLAGTLLFSGSVAASRLAGLSTGLAPMGGMLLVAGWVLHAVSAARR